MSSETSREMLRDVDAGRSDKTPFVALGAVTVVVAAVVLAVCAVVFIAYYVLA